MITTYPSLYGQESFRWWSWIRKNYLRWQDPQNGRTYAHGLPGQLLNGPKKTRLPLHALLKLVGDQPKQADSLLAGIERAVLGMKGFLKPAKWDHIRSKLGMNPTVLKLSVIFGDPQATEEMEKVSGR